MPRNASSLMKRSWNPLGSFPFSMPLITSGSTCIFSASWKIVSFFLRLARFSVQ